MCLACRVGASVALVLIFAAAGAENSPSTHAPPSTLLTAREAHDILPQEAARAYPIHLRAVVTYYDPYIDSRHSALFVCDATGCIFVRIPSSPILPLQTGDVVNVEGVSEAGDYAPIVDQAQVRVVGHAHVPRQAHKASMAELLSGSMDCHWVEITGVVHVVRLSEWNATFEIATTEGPISVITRRDAGIDYDQFVDSLVLVHGNAAPVFNRKRQKVGVHIFFPSLHEITVVQPAPPDPFAMPVLSLTSLLLYIPGKKTAELAHRVHVQGRVTLQWPGRMLCIQQESDGFCMNTAQAARVNVGDLVDVLGFPAIKEFKLTMEDATYRLASGGAVPLIATPTTMHQALQGDHDGELVIMEGKLIGQDSSPGDLTLILRSGNFLFPVVLPQYAIGSGALPWKEGSTLRLTGICSVQFDNETTVQGEGGVRPSMVRILLRSMGDIEVLRAPSWWTPWHMWEILGLFVVLVFVALAWIIVLRRQVWRQTQALRSNEERLRHLSEHDALTNLPNRVLLNDRLSMALQRAERFKERMGLLCVDVDQFKEVNDNFGHLVGDKLLCELAKRICHAVRLTDTVARFGGDEFIVLLPDLHAPEEAQAIAAKIVAAISAPFHVGPGKSPVSVTVSVGVCTYPEAGLDMETLLDHVDAAMYSVKEHGKNGFRVYSTDGM
ncbi:MAG: diguanylate cyclase domain-containing protein [Terracidiphilus sp.]